MLRVERTCELDAPSPAGYLDEWTARLAEPEHPAADGLIGALVFRIGEEWLGPDSAILKCLRLGVALHHGALPTAYRKEVERLLRDNVLKVTISSPTLAQVGRRHERAAARPRLA